MPSAPHPHTLSSFHCFNYPAIPTTRAPNSPYGIKSPTPPLRASLLVQFSPWRHYYRSALPNAYFQCCFGTHLCFRSLETRPLCDCPPCVRRKTRAGGRPWRSEVEALVLCLLCVSPCLDQRPEAAAAVVLRMFLLMSSSRLTVETKYGTPPFLYRAPLTSGPVVGCSVFVVCGPRALLVACAVSQNAKRYQLTCVVKLPFLIPGNHRCKHRLQNRSRVSIFADGRMWVRRRPCRINLRLQIIVLFPEHDGAVICG